MNENQEVDDTYEEHKDKIVKDSFTEQALLDNEEQYKDVPDCTTKEGYSLAKAWSKQLKDKLIDLEDQRVDKKKDSLEYGRKLDSIAKAIRVRIEAMRDPIKEARAVIDREVKEKEFRNNIRIKNLKDGINGINE